MDRGKNSAGYSGHSPAQLKDGADSLPQTVRPAAKRLGLVSIAAPSTMRLKRAWTELQA